MKKIFRMAIEFALAGAALLTGCTKDYAEDIAALQTKIEGLEKSIDNLQNAINSGCVITDIAKNSEGYVITTSDGKKWPVTNGINGKDGKDGKDGVNGKDGSNGKDGKDGTNGKDGKDGSNGKSAFELAQDAGFSGTLEEWLATLQGKDGKSAYDLAVEAGFTGDYAEWLASLQGKDGKSAYDLAVENGFEGDEAAWLDSLYPVITIEEVEGVPYWFINGVQTEYVAKGDKGDQGEKGEPGNFWKYDADAFQWVEYKINAEGEEEATGVKEDVFPNGYKPLTASWTDDKIEFANVACEWDEEGNVTAFKTVSIDLRTSLKSIVSIPDLYYAGIEAFKYYYLEYVAGGVIKDDYDTTDELGNIAQIFDKDTLYVTGKPYFAGSHSIAHYYVNPEAYDLENAEWSLLPDDKVYMPLFGTKHKGWTPNFVSAKREEKNPKIVDVEYTITNADCLEPDLEKYEAYIAEQEEAEDEITAETEGGRAAAEEECNVDVSIMHLEGIDAVNNNKVVASDFAAVLPMKQGVAALAFSKDKPADECPYGVDYDHLWLSAHEAVENIPSVYVNYTAGRSIINYVGVHMLDADETMPRTTGENHVLYTLEQLKATYPNFDIKYEFVSCLLGNHETVEESFGKLIEEDGKWYFSPCYADKDGKPVEIASLDPSLREKVGYSAVGRRPIVLATLVDNDNKDAKGNPAIVLAGYFKIHITEAEVEEPDEDDTFDGLKLKDFSGKPFTFDCATDSAATVWNDFNEPVLEDFFNIKYADWVANYEWLEGPTDSSAPADQYDTYIWDEDKVQYDENGNVIKNGKNGTLTYDKKLGYNKYGTIEFVQDTGAHAINDIFKVKVDWRQKQNIVKEKGGVVTLWAKFVKKGTGKYYFFGLTIKVNDHADASFIEHNANYWWPELTAEYKDKQNETVRRNVFVPNVWLSENDPSTNDDVTIYEKYLTDDWVGNIIQIKSGGKTYIPRDVNHELVADYDGNVFYKFLFTQPTSDLHSQPKINGIQWTTNETRDTLYYKTSAMKEKAPVVALNDTSGLVTYIWDEDSLYISKVLLNLWPADATEISKMLYCNVDLIAYSYVESENQDEEDCYIELGKEQIHVRFLRPISLEEMAPGELRDAVPTGDAIHLGDLFRARDWNRVDDPEGYLIFDWIEDSGKFITCYYPDRYDASTAKVEWYGYYGFSSLSIDVDNIESNQNGSWDKIKKVNPAAKFWLAPEDDHTDQTVYDINSVDISNLEDLSDIVFVYFNNVGVVDNFQLKIPVCITYAWGVLQTTVTVPVQGTKYQKTH